MQHELKLAVPDEELLDDVPLRADIEGAVADPARNGLKRRAAVVDGAEDTGARACATDTSPQTYRRQAVGRSR